MKKNRKKSWSTTETLSFELSYDDVVKMICDYLGEEVEGLLIKDIDCDVPIEYMKIVFEKNEGGIE